MRPRQVSDEAILEAARACLLEEGASVSTRSIAERAGVSQATLFKRFGSRERLVCAALAPARAPEVLRRLHAGPGPEPIPEQLERIGVAALAHFREVVPCMSALHAAGIDPRALLEGDDAPPHRARRLLTAWLERARAEGRVGSCDADAIAIAFIGALMARPFRLEILREPDRQGSDRAYVAAVVDALWRGLAPAAPEDAPGEDR